MIVDGSISTGESILGTIASVTRPAAANVCCALVSCIICGNCIRGLELQTVTSPQLFWMSSGLWKNVSRGSFVVSRSESRSGESGVDDGDVRSFCHWLGSGNISKKCPIPLLQL